jgi:hypothetical protein
MSATLKFFGAVFLPLLLLFGAVAGIYVPKALALQREAAAYMEANVPLIVENWNSEEVTKRAAPEFLVPSVREGLPKVFEALSQLGKLRTLGKPRGGVVVADMQLAILDNRVSVGINNKDPKPIWAEFSLTLSSRQGQLR